MRYTPKDINRLDSKFERMLFDLLHNPDNSEFTPEKKAERRSKADKDDLSFAKTYYPRVFDLPFNDVHRHIANLKQGNFTISGFPTSGKTAFTLIAKVVKPIAQGNGGLINICLRTQDISAQRTNHIYRIITNNRLLCYDYDIKVQQEKTGYYIINNTILVSTSVKTGLRNFIDDDFKRFKVSINDDLYNRHTVGSTVDNNNVTEFITGEIHRQMEPDGLSITLGNSITEDCPICQVKKLFPQNHFSFPIKDEKGLSNWEEKFPTESLAEKQADTPIDVWEGEWLDSPLLQGDTFDIDWLNGINVNLVKIISTISVADPAHGVSPVSCEKSLVTGSITSSNELIVEDIYTRQESYSLFFDYALNVMSKYPKWKALLFENDFGQWNTAAEYYNTWKKKRKTTIPIVMFNSSQNKTAFRGADKESRIMNLVHPHFTGSILYNELIMHKADYLRYRAQYLGFGKLKKKLDALDALASLYILIFRYKKSGSFEPTKKREFKDVFSNFKKGGWFK